MQIVLLVSLSVRLSGRWIGRSIRGIRSYRSINNEHACDSGVDLFNNLYYARAHKSTWPGEESHDVWDNLTYSEATDRTGHVRLNDRL